GMQPAVAGGQHALRRLFHRPGFGGAEVVRQKAADCRFGGDLADLAAADAVSQGHGDALGSKLRFARDAEAVKILVQRLATPIRMLPRANRKLTGHVMSAVAPLRRGRIFLDQLKARLGAVFTWVAYSVRPVKARPPTRLPSAVGI